MKIVPKKQIGFTLVELMVGIVLALLIIAATITVYLSSKQTNTLNQSIINIQNEGQLALQVLKDHVRQAGWARSTSLSYTLTSPIDLDKSTNSDGAAPDVLAIQYEGDFDCNGTAVTSDPVVNIFTVTDGSLTCNGQAVIDNVDSFQVLYGVKAGGNLQYVSLDDVVDQSAIESIKMAFSVSSDGAVPNGNPSRTISLLDVTMPEFKDKKARRVYDLTVAIINRPQLGV